MATNIHDTYVMPTMPSSGKLSANGNQPTSNHNGTAISTSTKLKALGRTSSSGMSASSEDTSDSGFYQLTPDPQGTASETRSVSPRPSPRAIRRLSNMTESTDAEDIDFFLKVVGEFRDYVSEKIEELEQQHKLNESCLQQMQTLMKQSETAWTASEVSLSQEIHSLVGLLQKLQGIYSEKIKKNRSRESDNLREKMDVCRRNMKNISGVLAFAARIKSEKDDSIRENTLRELKQKFTTASEMVPPNLVDHTDRMRKPDFQVLREIKEILEESINSTPRTIHNQRVNTKQTPSNKPPTISAQSSPNDVTKDSIIVRWIDEDMTDDVTYEIHWKSQRDVTAKIVKGITETQHVISKLISNSEITVQVQRHSSDATSELSAPAFFRTKPQPAKFHLDVDTANVKLQLSPDLFSVYYPGDMKTSAQKSPSRFTFALNVLGNISFFTGRHYWEVLVNVDGWAVGVAYRNVPRNSWLGSNDSSWILHFNPAKREYKARHAGESVDVKIRRKKLHDEVARVGIYVDYEAGIISFVDCYHMNVLHTYRTKGFTEPITAAVNPFYHGGVLTMITGLEIPDINFGI